jgi:hypothetical protein
MAIESFGSLQDLVQRGESIAAEAEPELPGLALQSLIVKHIREPFFQKYAESYLFGVALDASGEIRTMPIGQDKIGQFRKVEEGETVRYMGEGMLLVAPPTKGFLAIRLLLADSDSGAREGAEVIKLVGETVGSKELIAAAVAGGLPHAAAVALVLGNALKGASMMMEKNKDDVIELFEGYFTAASMREPLSWDTKNVDADFNFVTT